MIDAIVVDYDPFSMESRFYCIQGDKRGSYQVASDIPTLVDQIIDMANKTNLYTVKFNAPLVIISEVNKEIKKKELALYSENKITIEGI